MALFLFDVDMTLIDSAGAGRLAMVRAFHDLYGVSEAFAGIPFRGRTDRAILRDGLERHARLDGHLERAVGRFVDAYAAHLTETLRERPVRVMAGVPGLLDALEALPDARVGLATGNFRRGAMLKLGYVGLWDRLAEGGFGDHHEDRADMVAQAARRLRRGAGAPADGGPVLVIGDTPLDVAAAKANGFAAVGVASGFDDADVLRSCGADLVLHDFADVAAACAALQDLIHTLGDPR